MATAATTIQRVKISDISQKRRISTGIIEICLAVFIYFVFASNIAAETLTTFVMTPGGITAGAMADWVIPTRLTLLVLIGLCTLIGLYQLARGFGKFTNGMMGLVFLFFIFSFLTWQASGKSLNLAGMLSSAVLLAVPITLGAFTGLLCESAGVINIAIEGMMLMAAMVGALMGSVTGNAWLGLLCGILSALILSAIHAVLSIKYKIVSRNLSSTLNL